MAETRVSIGRVKRDISDLVNRVAYGGERIVLTSRGKPKAAIVSIDDYERLEQEEVEKSLAQWEAWLAESEKLAADILARRQGKPLDVDALWEAARADLEERDARTLGR
jgi:prevent-host-death family protein